MTIQIFESNVSREGVEAVANASSILRYCVTDAADSSPTTTGDVTNGSAVIINVASVASFIPGVPIAGTGIPAGAVVKSIDSATQITLSANATATNAGVTLTFQMDDDSNAKLLIQNTIPAYYLQHPLKNYRLVPKGSGFYDVEVNYERRAGEFRFRASGAGGKTTLKQSYNSAYYPSPSLAPTKLTPTGTTAAGSAVITAMSSTAGIAVGAIIVGTSQSTATGNMSSGSAVLTGLTQTNLFNVGASVAGNGVPSGVTVQSIDSSSQITLSALCFDTANTVPLTFVTQLFPPNTYVVSVDSPTQITAFNQALETGAGLTLTITQPTVIDFKRAINVSGEGKGEPAGVEITIPNFTFTVQRSIQSPMSSTYANLLYTLCGHKNSGTVTLVIEGLTYVFQPGELLYLYPEFGIQGTDDWEVTLYCAGSPNVSGLIFGDIAGVSKEGWAFLWVSYRKDIDAISNVTILKPQQVCVEQVYLSADLNPLFS